MSRRQADIRRQRERVERDGRRCNFESGGASVGVVWISFDVRGKILVES